MNLLLLFVLTFTSYWHTNEGTGEREYLYHGRVCGAINWTTQPNKIGWDVDTMPSAGARRGISSGDTPVLDINDAIHIVEQDCPAH